MLGLEVSGTIAGVGEGVSDLAEGIPSSRNALHFDIIRLKAGEIVYQADKLPQVHYELSKNTRKILFCPAFNTSALREQAPVSARCCTVVATPSPAACSTERTSYGNGAGVVMHTAQAAQESCTQVEFRDPLHFTLHSCPGKGSRFTLLRPSVGHTNALRLMRDCCREDPEIIGFDPYVP